METINNSPVYTQPADNNQPQQQKKEFNFKAVIAVLCVLVLLLMTSNIGMILYIFKNRNTELDVEKNYEQFVTIQDAINNGNLTIAEIALLAQDYSNQGLVVTFEEDEEYVLLETEDGVNYLYVIEDELTKTVEFMVSVLEPGQKPSATGGDTDLSAPGNDLSFFDKTHNRKFILLDGRIAFTFRFGPVLRTNLRVDDIGNWRRFAKELRNREMIVGREYFYICPSFFRTHLKANAMQNCVLILHHAAFAKDNRFLKTLFAKGLGMAVIIAPDLADDLQNQLSSLFMENLSEQTSDGTYRSAKDSVAQTIAQFQQDNPDAGQQDSLLQVYFPEGEDDFCLPDKTTAEPIGDDTSPNAGESKNELVTLTPSISPNSAVFIYLKNFDLWKADTRDRSIYHYYSFLDLDFDGVLELVTTINTYDATSQNHYYQIDLFTKDVVGIGNMEAMRDYGGMDLKGSTVLYKNNETNKPTYYSDNTVEDVGTYYGSLWYEDYTVYSELSLLQAENKSDTANNQSGNSETYYLNDEKISEADYAALVEDFKKKNTNLNLQWKSCAGERFDKANESEQHELLMEAYNAFTYDGYLQRNTGDSDFKIATEKDFYDLSYFCDEINEDYNCKDDNALEFALSYLIGDLPFYRISFYPEDDTSVVHSQEEPNDPLNYFYPIFDAHHKYPGEKVDGLLRTVFNVQPDHDFVIKNGDYIKQYYYDGYYYVSGNELGESIDGPLLVERADMDENGIYTITLREKAGTSVDAYRRKLDIKAEIKNINGKRVWSIYSVDYAEPENFYEYQKMPTLTDAAAEELWFTANDIYCSWAYWREQNYFVNTSTPIYLPHGIEDWPYYPVIKPNINSIADLKLLLSDYFDEAIIEDILWGYIDHNGNLYASALAIGSDNTRTSHITVKSQSETSAILEINRYDIILQEAYTVEQTLEYINGKWIFTEYFYRNY